MNTAKLLVGKDIESSMLTYLSEVNHKKAFLEIKTVLNLTNGRMKSTVDAKDAEIEKLKKQNEDLQRQMNILAMMLRKELLEEAQKQGVVMEKKTGEEASPIENLKALAKIKEEEEQAEYERLLNEKNGNGNNGT